MQVGAPRWGQWVAVAVFVLLALLVKAPQFVTPMGQDQGLYNAVADEILRGGVPYRDAWDPKPPGVFYTHAAVLSLMPDPWRACRIGTLPGLSRSDLEPRCGTLLFGAIDLSIRSGWAPWCCWWPVGSASRLQPLCSPSALR